MLVSLGLPTCMEGMMYPVPFINPEQICEIAKLAEAVGYHSVWGNDHITTQNYVRALFPGRALARGLQRVHGTSSAPAAAVVLHGL